MQVRSALRCNIPDTRKSVLTGYQVGRKNEAQPSFFNRLRGVWIPDETLFQVFDTASQTIKNSWRNSKQKFAKFYAAK